GGRRGAGAVRRRRVALTRGAARGAAAPRPRSRRPRRAPLSRGLSRARARAGAVIPPGRRPPADGVPDELVALAPAKVNLGLFLGAARGADARHELVTVMQSISLADEVSLEAGPAGAGADEVVCPGVAPAAGENLAATALRSFREATGWQAPPLR